MIFLDFEQGKTLTDNLAASEQILGWNIIGTSFATDYGTTIDLLAFDNDGVPIIVQSKRNPADNIALEALSYYNNITGHKSAQADFMAQSRYPNAPKLLWDRAKLVLIAPSFNKYDIDTVSSFPIATDAYTYSIINDKLILVPQYIPTLDHTEEEEAAYSQLKDSLANAERATLNDIEQYLSDMDANIKRLTIGTKIRYYIIADLLSLTTVNGEIIMNINGTGYGSTQHNLLAILRETIQYGK